jgi:hypothetical protein
LNKTKQKNLTIDNHSIGLHSAVYTKKKQYIRKKPRFKDTLDAIFNSSSKIDRVDAHQVLLCLKISSLIQYQFLQPNHHLSPPPGPFAHPQSYLSKKKNAV